MVCKAPVPALLTLLSPPPGWNVRTAPWSRIRHMPSRSSFDTPHECRWSFLELLALPGPCALALSPSLLSRASGPVIVSIKVLSRCSSGPPRPSCIPPRTLPNFALYTECGADGPPAVSRVVSVSVTTLAKKHRGQRIIHWWELTNACRVIGLSY